MFNLSRQQLLIYEMVNLEGDAIGTITARVSFHKAIDSELLINAVRKLIDENPILTVSIDNLNFEPTQNYMYSSDELYSYRRFSSEEEVKKFATYFALESLSFHKQLCHFVMFNTDEDTYGCVLKIHHLISDGWSFKLLFQRLGDICFALQTGEERPVVGSCDYFEYLKKDKLYEESARFEIDKKFWIENCADIDNLRMFSEKPSIDSKASEIKYDLSESLTLKIKSYCSENSISILIFFLLAVDLYINKTNLDKDKKMYVGVSFYNRAGNEEKNIVGMFANTHAMSASLDMKKSVRDNHSLLKKRLGDVIRHQRYSYNQLLLDLRQSNKELRYLYDLTINYLIQELENLDVKSIDWYSNGRQLESLNISINEWNIKNKMNIKYSYRLDKMNQVEVETLHKHIFTIIDQLLNENVQLMEDIPYIDNHERELLLKDFNNTYVKYDKEKTIIQLIEEQVKRTPNEIAFVYHDEKIIYSELNSRANYLAYRLQSMGLEKESFVGILAERSIDMIIAVVAVMKAAGAYIPLDIDYPEDRIRYIVEDSNMKLLITYKVVRSYHLDIPIVDLTEYVWVECNENPNNYITSDQLLYCIYTSGTTGKPKGVLIENKSVVNYCTVREHSMMNIAMLRGYSKMISVTNMVFDIFVTEMIFPLVNGIKVYIADKEEQTNSALMLQLVEKNSIQIMQTTPSRIKMILGSEYAKGIFSTLRLVLVGGEAVDSNLVNDIRSFSNIEVINVYGPSETTVWSTFSCFSEGKVDNVTIGKPIANTQIYILNNIELCGIHVAGELCIAGDGLARGYLNKDEITKRQFIENPFGKGRLYRTGDLAKWLNNGELEFLGRIDDQVKLHGYRIELREVESVLRNTNLIKDCAVVIQAIENSESELCAYVVMDEESNLQEMKARVRRELPGYMVPTYYMIIDMIPINKNGKLDKSALPKIEAISSSIYVAPENNLEELVCNAFEDCLEIKKVSTCDSFFDLGGHSLKAIRLVNEIEAKTGCRIKIGDIFSRQTVKEIAKLLQDNYLQPFNTIEKVEKRDYYAVSSAQKRIYMVSQFSEDTILYNIPSIYKIAGQVDDNKLRITLHALHRRHEVLRSSIKYIDDNLVQEIGENEPEIDFMEDNKTSDYDLFIQFARPFKLENGPLYRIRVIKKNEYLLFFIDMHHIISDGISVDIYMNELAQMYNGEQLSDFEIQYKDYCNWFNKQDLSQQRNYWLNQFNDEIPVLNMQLDFNRPQYQSHVGSMEYQDIDNQMVNEVRKLALETGTTEYMIYLSVLMILLSKYSGQEDILVGTPVSGRTSKDTEKLLGMFANTLVMRGKPEGLKKYIDFLYEVKEVCLQGYDNQDYPFEELINELEIERDMSRNPLFSVMFAFQREGLVQLNFNGVTVERMEQPDNIAKFDMTVGIQILKEKYYLGIEYCTSLFRKETIQYLLLHYRNILNSIVRNKYITISAIETINGEEKHLICNEFSNNLFTTNKNNTFTKLFEDQVMINPNNIAVTYDGKASITYKELNEKANVLARRLRILGVNRNDFIAIITERSIEMIIGICAIIKAGAAYVPIAVDSPNDRIQYILEDCKPIALLYYKVDIHTTILSIDLEDPSLWDGDTSNLEIVNMPDDLIYLIYTSGTTGNPKGVMIEHHSAANMKAIAEYDFRASMTDKVLLFANIAFDASAGEVMMSLTLGCSLCIPNENFVNDYRCINDLIKKEKVSILSFPPQFAAYIDIVDAKFFLTAGSEAPAKVVETIVEKTDYINCYGPTETTVCATFWKCDKKGHVPERVPIGKPNVNYQIYILNDMQLCGIGVPGELCIGGEGVARGYLNRPELTREKFIENPFSAGRLYRSGDLARWLPDGNIEYPCMLG